MTLTIAIPVHDDEPYLLRLLGRLARLGCADQLVVVDDGSHAPLDHAALCAAAALPADRLTLLRHDTAQGPGAARNAALAHVDGDHLLYLDADDLPTRELPPLLADLAGQTFDFCIFRHHDTRSEIERRWGPEPLDGRLWRAAGTDIGALTPVGPAAAAALMQTANYPWNKIYRTGFLRDHGIGCSDLAVHEDIELHWRSFLSADRILASDRICLIHFVDAEGDRLTNRLGPERLEVFVTLDRVAEDIAAREADPLPFALFTLGLIGWIHGHLLPELRRPFATRARDWLNRRVDPALYPAIDAARPEIRAHIDQLLDPAAAG
ncbi:glycosyltransferase family 2 protein [Sedimentitalea todarodis]|uniref:Glycosyltransferase family 2 protein n=1 Tax=Sedimentitalea todarodis TaxID=1631240 RepID=A0ABU3VK43_9RHOB|nr:glycosyltransferase family 2 protein [Sedimentitalea todarodis]MDU9006561.1 glycosyltransferase family 2 protein [Sedimentitalea todarodis]